MKLAAIYDVHGNLPALQAVLDEIRGSGVDRVVVGGDVVPGPMPREVIAALLAFDLPVDFLRGNGETAVLTEAAGSDSGVPAGVRDVVRWSAAQVCPEHRTLLGSWPATLRLEVPRIGDVLFCHATPRSETEIFTARTPEEILLPILEPAGADLIVCGHTHMQFDRKVGSTRVINAGSVGMPFGETGAHWLLLDGGVELRRTSYDLTAAAERVRATAYPHAERFAAHHVLRCPTETEMLDRFAAAERR